MKKTIGIFASILTVLLIGGCSGTKTMTCTKTETDDDGLTSSAKVVIKYNDEKVLNVENTATMELDETYYALSLSLLQTYEETFNNLEGISYEVKELGDNKLQFTMSVDYEKVSAEDLETALGTDVNIDRTIDEYTADLDGYTCK